MADRSVVVRLRAEAGQYKAAMDEAAKATKKVGDESESTGKRGSSSFADLNKWVDKNSQSLNDLSNKAGLTGIALVGVAALAVKKWADFDQAMSSVAATGQDAKNSISDLRQAAIDAGRDTVYSATESANAIEDMAKAGVSAADILSGGLTGALNLAAAGQMDVSDAASIAATTMNQFGLQGKDVSHIADVLAASAGKANGEVADFGLAMKYVGPVSAQLGVSLEETSGTLALLAQNGLLADNAGTGLRGVMMALTAPTAAAQKTLDQYNISAFDAQGKFVGMASLAGQLQTRLGGLTEAQRSEALGRIFGNEQITTARILYASGASAVEDWTKKVNDSGYASVVAATKLDNLKGDWEQLTGSVETALIGMGSGSDGALRGLVQTATEVVNAFSSLPATVQQGTLSLVGGSGLVLLGIAGLGKLVVSVNEVKTATAAMGISMKDAAVAAGVVGTVLAAASVGLVIWSQQQANVRENVKSLQDSLDATTGAITGSTRAVVAARLVKPPDWWDEPFGISASDGAKKLGINLNTLTDAILGNGKAWDEVTAVVGDSAFPDDIASRAAEAGLSVGDYNKAVMAVRRELQGNAKDLDTARQQQLDMNSAVGDSTTATGVAKTAIETYTDAQATGTATTKDYVDALKEMIDAQSKAAGVALDLFDAQTNIEDAFAAATRSIKDNGATLDVTTEKGRANRDALKEVASAGWDLITSMQANGASQGDLQATMASTRDRFMDVATQMGLSSDEASALADQLNLIPANVSVAVAVDTAKASDAINQFVALQNGRTITMNVETGAFRVNGTSVRGYAGGGEVVGPGTETSDSVPALLSVHEHVWSAAEVRGAGGHGRVAAMRAAARSGGPVGLAAGGTVQRYSGVASPAWSTAGVTAPSSVDNSRTYQMPITTVQRLTPSDLVQMTRLAEALEPAWG